MEKLYVIFLIALALAHGTARNIPIDQTKTSSTTSTDDHALAHVEKTENVVTSTGAQAANGGVDDQKNFITYGGVGGWAGIGGFAGVIPVIPVLGGIGGASGVGGLGGLGGVGGAGGLGGLGGAGGVGGLGGAAAAGGAKSGAAGKIVP